MSKIITKGSFPKWKGATLDFRGKNEITFYSDYNEQIIYYNYNEALQNLVWVNQYTVKKDGSVVGFMQFTKWLRLLKKSPN